MFSRYLPKLIFIVTVLIFTQPVTMQIATAQSGIPTWTQPESLGLGWWQSLTVDQQGTAYVGWFQGRTDPATGIQIGSDLLMFARKTLNEDWDIVDVIATNTQGYTIRNAYAVTSDGTIYTAFRRQLAHNFSYAHVENAHTPQAWAEPNPLNPQGYYMDFIADDQDNLHFVYSGRVLGATTTEDQSEGAESNPCLNCADLFYMRSDNQGKSWSRPYPLSIEATTGSDRVDIYQTPTGRIYIDWDEGLDWYSGRGNAQDVRIVYSDDYGLTWSDPIILDGGDFLDRSPIQIATTEMHNGDIMAVWRYDTSIDNRIYYQLSSDSGLTWTEPAIIEGIYARNLNETPLDDYQLVTDLLGTVHLFAVGRSSPDVLSNSEGTDPTSLFHIEYRQGNWRNPQLVMVGRHRGDTMADPTGIGPEWPKAEVGPLNDIHLSWFVRHLNPDGSDRGLEVFYAYRSGNTLQQPLPTFVPTAQPEPTQMAVFVPTLTPYPTVEPVTNTNVRVTSDQYAIQTVLSGLFVSVLVCAGAIGFSRIRLR